ncbi:MAG: iron-containing alcohol dehydrogenase [Eubacteriales bacterium]|nr:iron-containing alcohol dehydrogenase [Eubacteriales bacterium]
MENFRFYAPTYFCFGKGEEQSIGELIARFGGHKVLLHYGGGSIQKNGVYDRVVKALNDSQIPYVELPGVKPNPRSGLVYEGIELCRRENIDFILAVGGGSAIDSAKAIAAGVPYEGDFWDYYSTGKTVDTALPVGTVLTIAAAGSEGSPDSVITHEQDLFKRGATGEAMRPKFSILNPESTLTLPRYQTACGITDIMAHVCERYFTNTENVEITDRLCEGVLKAVIEEAPKVIADPENYDARANIMWSGMVAHNNIVGVGREQDWNSHRIEHELSAFYDVAHGAGLAVIMPAWMKHVMRHDVRRFAQFAVRVWGCDMNFVNPEITAAEGIARFRAFLTAIGMPATLAGLGIQEVDIPKLVDHLFSAEKEPLPGFMHLTREDVTAIYKLASEG